MILELSLFWLNTDRLHVFLSFPDSISFQSYEGQSTYSGAVSFGIQQYTQDTGNPTSEKC